MNIHMNLKENSYDIVVQRGILDECEKHINLERRVLIVTDSGVPKNYAETIAKKCKTPVICTIDSGENSKSLETFGNRGFKTFLF